MRYYVVFFRYDLDGLTYHKGTPIEAEYMPSIDEITVLMKELLGIGPEPMLIFTGFHEFNNLEERRNFLEGKSLK